MTLDAGTRLGPYEVLGLLGAGGMGEVYRARDTRLGRDVAVKVPPAIPTRPGEGFARFDREARAAAALQHPNILDVHDVGEIDGRPFVVTELLVGETLRERIAKGPVPWERALEIAAAIGDGLAAAHGAGLVHRDIKPENVFLTSDGRVKILDFGLVREEAPAGPGERTLTEDGVVVGTVGYMSPEQLRGGTADARSDLFALGCVLYEMLAGRRAFGGATAAEVWSGVLTAEPERLSQCAPGVPREVAHVVERCLEKSPAMRFQAANDLTFALRMAGHGSAAAALPTPRPSPNVARVAAAAGVVAAALALAFALRGRTAASGASLAVLPFAGSGDEADYLGEGLAESLINRLARLPRLHVVARTSAFKGGAGRDARAAGRELGVAAVVTGRVSRRGDQLVVQADLVDVAKGDQLWGEKYARPFADIVSVEDDIATEITRALGSRLAGGAAEAPASEPASAEAYDLYLQGRFHANRRDEGGLRRALDLYARALEKDPRFAPAWCGVADAYNLVAFYGGAPPRDVVPKARDAALKALSLDERTPEAHVSLGDILYQYDWDWTGAEREYRRAIQLAPNAAASHHWYSNYLSVASRFGESIDEIGKARALDPMNPLIGNDLALASYWAGRLDDAAARLSDLVRTEPSFPLAHLYLALVRAHQGRFGEAEESVARLEAASGGASPDSIALRGWVAARAGRREDARKALATLEELAKSRFVSAFPIAFVELGLGDRDAALAGLERAYEERAGRLVYLKVERAFDPLRADPRFQALVAKLRIPG